MQHVRGEIIKFLLVLPVESDFRGTYNVLFGLAPPLGLLYLARVLEDDGNEVEVLDFSAEKFEPHKLLSRLPSVDVVGMTVMSTSVHKVRKMIEMIKEKDPDIPVVIGGPHCNIFPARALQETHADISVQGDGEKVITEIKKALNNEKSLSEIPGVFYRTKDTIKKGPPHQPIKNLDSLPFPARHLVKKYLYGRAYNPRIKKGEFTSIVTSRGCPFRCKFCSRRAVNLNLYRTRSTENILEEIRVLQSEGYKYIAIEDDSFLSNRRQAHAIFDAIIREGIDMKFYITAARVDSADRDLYRKMKKAGVVSIQFGLESASQRTLDFYNKKITVEQIKYAVKLSHEMGFLTSGTFVLGAPFETKRDFKETVKLAKSLPLEVASFLPLRYRAITELWVEAVKEGKIAPDEYEVMADSNRGLGLYTAKELLKYCEKAQLSFYLRPKYFVFLLKSSLEKNDFSILHMLISIYLSAIKEHINPFRLHSKKDQKRLEIR